MRWGFDHETARLRKLGKGMDADHLIETGFVVRLVGAYM